jgi:hypothetical protein
MGTKYIFEFDLKDGERFTYAEFIYFFRLNGAGYNNFRRGLNTIIGEANNCEKIDEIKFELDKCEKPTVTLVPNIFEPFGCAHLRKISRKTLNQGVSIVFKVEKMPRKTIEDVVSYKEELNYLEENISVRYSFSEGETIVLFDHVVTTEKRISLIEKKIMEEAKKQGKNIEVIKIALLRSHDEYGYHTDKN